jgi:hypothetical protein
MIIGLSQPVIRYVDCFSGPWNDKDLVQPHVREKAKQENREKRTRQRELFDSADGTNVVGSVDIEKVKAYLLRKITGSSMTFGIEHLADMMVDTGLCGKDSQAAFKEFL